jgi:protease-4
LDKIGLGTETIKSGDLKDVLSYARPMEQEERLMIQNVVMDTYEQFVEIVAEGRGLEKEEVYPFADGAVFTGLQAYNHGLVDTIGGLKEAIDLAAELAGIDGDPEVIRPYERKRSSWANLLGGVLGEVRNALDKDISGPQLMYLYK